MKRVIITIILVAVLTILALIFKFSKDSINKYVTPRFSNSEYKVIKNGESIIELWNFKGKRDTIILVSGGPGVPTYLSPIAEYLNNKGFNVTIYNQRGTGNSTTNENNYDIENHIDDLEIIRKELKIDKFHIFGHSWGGLLAQLYINKYPKNVKTLFLSNSSIGIGNDWEIMENKVMQYNKEKSELVKWTKMGILSGLSMLNGDIGNNASRSMMNMVWKNYFDNSNEIDDADNNWLNGINSSAIYKTRNSIINANKNMLKKIKLCTETKVLILYGEKDIYGNDYKSIYERFDNSDNIILKKSGHLPWLQNNIEYYSILDKFYGEYK